MLFDLRICQIGVFKMIGMLFVTLTFIFAAIGIGTVISDVYEYTRLRYLIRYIIYALLYLCIGDKNADTFVKEKGWVID